VNSNNIIKNGICSVPWLHTEINLQTNSIFPCCKYDGPSLGKPQDFIEVWAGKEYSQLRQDLANNIIRSECQACDVAEDSFSYKKFKNTAYQYFNQGLSTNALPRVIHITLKNTCNFACRMCHPASSSRLHELSKKSIFLNDFYKANIDNKFDIKLLSGIFGNLQRLTITGGEPLIDEDCIDLLAMVEQESKRFNTLTLSSNLSVIHPKMFDALGKTHANVNINVSIDGPDYIHEYIRYGCNWNNIATNLKKLKGICYGMGVNTTISAMNVGYLHELIEAVIALEATAGIKFTHLMPTPVLESHLHAGNLPPDVKKLYKEKLIALNKNYELPGANTLIQTGISLLDAPVKSNITVTRFLGEFDRIANTDYRRVYPELIDTEQE
jgi:MoaA/NifB/PqqE/SkfB family radical SAM enzyme